MSFHLVLQLPPEAPFNSTAFKKICNQYLITRLLIGASRAGVAGISIVGNTDVVVQARKLLEKDRRLRDLNISWGTAVDSNLPIVRGTADTVIGNAAWTLLANAQNPAYLPGAPHWIKNTEDRSEAQPLWPEAEWQKGRFAIQIHSEQDLKLAKNEIFQTLTKTTSGPVSRHINARLSLPLSRLLVETPLTPNQMTIINTVIGVVSALFFAIGSLAAVAVGGILFQLSAALDRCDGELARSKFMESDEGAWIDTVGDNLTYIVFMICLVIGYARYTSQQSIAWQPLVLPLGLGLIVATIGLITWMFRYVKKHNLGGSITAISNQFSKELDNKKSGRLYRILSKLQVLGKRDQFSLAIMIVAVMPVLTGNDAWYHALFFGTIAAVVAMNLYFVNASRKLSKAKLQQAES